MDTILSLFVWFVALGVVGLIFMFVMPMAVTFLMFVIMSPFMLIGWVWSKITGE